MVLCHQDGTALWHVENMGSRKTNTAKLHIYVESKEAELRNSGMVGARGWGVKKWRDIGQRVQRFSYAGWIKFRAIQCIAQ